MNAKKKLNRRDFLKAAAAATGAMTLAACAPQVVKETVIVEKPVEKTVKETVVVEKVVEKIVTAVPPPAPVLAEGLRIGALGPYMARTGVSGDLDIQGLFGEKGLAAQMEVFDKYYDIVRIWDTVPAGEKRAWLMTALAAGDPPDIQTIVSADMPAFAEIGALLPLDEMAERDDLDLSIYYPAEIGSHSYKGHLYSVPILTAGSHSMYYMNNKYIDEVGLDPTQPPDTWQELEAWAEVVKDKKPGSFLLEHTKTFNKPMFMVWLYNNGGSMISDDLRTIEFNSADGLDTLKWMLDFAELQAGDFESMSESPGMGEASTETFFAGTYVTRIGGSWGYYYLKRDNPDVEMTMARLPYNKANPNAKRQDPSDGGWGYLIPRGGKNPDAAWEFAKFMSAGEGNHTFILGRNRPSPVKAYTEDPALKEVQPFMAPIIEDMEQGVVVPLTAVHNDIKLSMQDMTEAVLYYRMTPEEALEKYAADAQKVLDNYWKTYG